MSDLTKNACLPWVELGRVKSCVIENVPAIGASGYAPEAYVPGCFLELILEAVNTYEASHARIKELEEALRPFAFFGEQWNRQPIDRRADEFYGIHSGTEYEAFLKVSDCQRAAAVLNPKRD